MNTLDKQIILDVYREHCLEQVKYLRHGGTIQEFINKIKTDKEFSEKWGLKIEERELRLGERIEILRKIEDSIWLNTGLVLGVIEPMLEEQNIPTKLITLTYNNEKI